jgi:small-conductance mechanosensitive channel
MMVGWLTENWLLITVPVLAFLASYVVGLWVRRVLSNAFERWATRVRWQESKLVMTAVHRPFLFWFLILGVFIAIQVSIATPEVKGITTKALGILFVLSLGWLVINLGGQLLETYLPRLKVQWPTITLAKNVTSAVTVVVCALIMLEIWGMPTSPLLVLIAVGILAAALAFRNAAPNLFAGLQLGTTQQIKVGDYIKLETGEQGYVTEITLSNTRIKALDESVIIVPNNRLLQFTVVNYGHPLKKAAEPFRFYSRTYIKELTGLKAKSLRELVDTLKKVPDSVIYYHTHHFLEEHHYLIPEPSNDFAVWVNDVLGEEVLGERLASVNTFEFPSLGILRERIVVIIEEHLAGGANSREAMPGREFCFMKSVTLVMSTPYVADDLREFVEALRKISLGSLYFHVFESKLRLGRGLNDFTIWLQDSLKEEELGEEIARLDPYTYTLEGLRSAFIQLIEKRIK